jgi:hypothetical protein
MNPIFPDYHDEHAEELISAYLRGELTEAEKAGVDQRRSSDPQFNDLFVAYQKLSGSVRATHLQDKLNGLRTHAKSEPALEALRTRRMIRRVAAAAVILFVLFAGFKYLIPHKHDKIFTEHFSNRIIPGRGELSTDTEDAARAAFDFYQREQYGKAAREFDKLANGDEPIHGYSLYAAVAHLGAGHLKRASRLLDKASVKYPGNKPEILFLQTLILVKRGDLDKAKQILAANESLVKGNRDLTALRDKLWVMSDE